MATWSKRRRLEATILGEPVDRPPVALWRHWPGDDQDAAAQAAAHLKWQQDYDWDLIKVSPASSFCLVDWGVEDRWEGAAEGTRTYVEHVVHHPDDWERLEVLDPRTGMLATQIEALQLLGQELRTQDGGETPFIATIFSPLAQAKNLAGQLGHLRSNPDSFHIGLDTITASTIAYIEAAKATGIAGIFFAVQHARYELMGQEEYASIALPYDQRILEAAGDLWLNMVHIHGDDSIIFELASHYPVQIFNWHDRDSGISLNRGLEMVSGAVSGGVSRWSLLQDAPDMALAEAADAMEHTGGRRLMLGVGCVIMTNTPTRNIRALREFAEST
jgi:uroporphyrinogen decarboxylase